MQNSKEYFWKHLHRLLEYKFPLILTGNAQDFCREYAVFISLYLSPSIAKRAVIMLMNDVQNDERNETWTTPFGSLAVIVSVLVKPHHVVVSYNRQVKEKQ